jgi:multimeric flavodoxin WrbA
MNKIIGIVGSPRVDGNTEYLVNMALSEAKKDVDFETELIRLAGKTIKPCTACLACKNECKCIIEDDFEFIFKKMVSADGIILGSPVYFGSATPELKSLIDRAGYVSTYNGRLFENKVGGPIVVARRAGQNFTYAQLLFFFLHQGMIVPGSTYWNIAFGRDKGEVQEDEEGIKTVLNFGKKIVWVVKKLKNVEKS